MTVISCSYNSDTYLSYVGWWHGRPMADADRTAAVTDWRSLDLGESDARGRVCICLYLIGWLVGWLA